MQTESITIIVAIITVVGSVLAARWQSKTTAKATLESAEAEFRDDLLSQVNTLRSDVKQFSADRDALIIKNAELSAQVITLQAKVERLVQDLTARQLERDILKRQVEYQQKEIAALQDQLKLLERELNVERTRTR